MSAAATKATSKRPAPSPIPRPNSRDVLDEELERDASVGVDSAAGVVALVVVAEVAVDVVDVAPEVVDVLEDVVAVEADVVTAFSVTLKMPNETASALAASVAVKKNIFDVVRENEPISTLKSNPPVSAVLEFFAVIMVRFWSDREPNKQL